MNTQWIYDTPVHSDVEEKLRHLLTEIGDEEILGIQVCAYKGGHVIIDTVAGVLGRDDPRPVQPDSLFPVFSVTKGITAGMVHWLVDMGKLKLEEPIANIWPEFGNNGKDLIKVHHVLNHTSGLQNAMTDFLKSNPSFLYDWDKCLQHIAGLSPETEPGSQQQYHSLSFGWLCGAVIEYASGKKFQEVLEEAIVHPLNIEGELYIGIPPGVESRLATLIDTEESEKFMEFISGPDPPGVVSHAETSFAVIFNALEMRRAIIPASNGHMTARALARYYAALATGGIVPPPHSNLSKPPLGSHTHIPKPPSPKSHEKKRGVEDYNEGNSCGTLNDGDITIDDDDHSGGSKMRRMFSDPKVLDAFVGVGDYSSLVLPNGCLGLGFSRFRPESGEFTSFGHAGIGGSTGFTNIDHDFSIAVTVNKLSLGGVTRRIIKLVCSELNVPMPDEFLVPGTG